METANIFFESDNCKIIPMLEDSIQEFKVQLQLKFWKEFKNKMIDKKFQICEKLIFEGHNEYERQQTECIIREIHQSRKSKNKWYGITFYKPCSKQQLTKCAVRVEIDHNNQGHDFILWGTVLVQFGDNEKNPSRIQISDDSKFISGIREKVNGIMKDCTHDLQL